MFPNDKRPAIVARWRTRPWLAALSLSVAAHLLVLGTLRWTPRPPRPLARQAPERLDFQEIKLFSRSPETEKAGSQRSSVIPDGDKEPLESTTPEAAGETSQDSPISRSNSAPSQPLGPAIPAKNPRLKGPRARLNNVGPAASDRKSGPELRPAEKTKQITDAPAAGSLLQMRSAGAVASNNEGTIRNKGLRFLGTASQKREALPELSPPDQATPPQNRKQRRIIIADYPFELDIDGNLRYSDPSKDFLALLHDDGSVEFESRSFAQGGICALGLCVMAGGLRSAKERKRKRLNRVRVRFAPVPLGIGGSFGSTRGIPAKQLKFLRATFEARLEMRMKSLSKRRARHLRELSRELRKIWRTRSPKEARRIILARAFDLEPPAPLPEDLEPQRKQQLESLRSAEQQGQRGICEQVLAFVERKHRSVQSGGFTDQELTKVKEHCAMLNQRVSSGQERGSTGQ